MGGFIFTRTPAIRFGAGRFADVPDIVRTFGSSAILVTGDRSFRGSEKYEALLGAFRERSVECHVVKVSGEPSPELVDRTCDEYRGRPVHSVLAVGGGSVIDAGKAISAMLVQDGTVFDYLEGVGTGRTHDGRKVPFIAVPTTAGTGSEATRNAVLSRVGPGGFKKSLRHDAFVPDIAVVDPELALSCPPDVTAACGMDAFTQLLEAYVSVKSSPMTDALAWSGMERAKDALVEAYMNGDRAVDAREGMAYAALMSGLALANAGLGVVHGFASGIGGLFPIPHGVVCGVLLEPATRITIGVIRDMGPEGVPALEKYARVGRLAAGAPDAGTDEACRLLLQRLAEWRDALRMPRFGSYGVSGEDIDAVIAKSGSGNNPVKLEKGDMAKILADVI